MTADTAKRLLAAYKRGDWADVLDALAAKWSELYQNHPATLLEVIEAMPEEVLDREPRLRLAQEHVRRNLRHEPETQAYRDVLRQNPGASPIDYLAALTGRIAVARAAGRHLDAVSITEQAVTYLESLGVEVVPRLGNALPEFHYHWGLTYLHVGRFREAAHQFSLSYDWAAKIDHRMMLVAAGGGIAFIHALHGRGRDAISWLEKLPHTEQGEWWVGFAPTAAALARALVYIDRLDLRAASSELSTIDIVRSLDYWSPYFAVRAFLVTQQGRSAHWRTGQQKTTIEAQALLAAFEGFIESLPPKLAEVPLSSEYASLTRYLLLIHLHQPERAVEELRLEGIAATASVVRQVGATLYASRLMQLGQPAAARKLVAPLLRVRDTRPRILIPALMIIAATDTIDRAEGVLDRAVALAEWNGSYIGFTLSAQPVRFMIADRLASPDARAVAQRLREISDAPAIPGFDGLTRRETAVVGSLFEGLSNTQIAEAHQVSVNTVKSQLRSVYRKLGVSTRSQVVELFQLGN